jgi:hypothetical protein
MLYFAPNFPKFDHVLTLPGVMPMYAVGLNFPTFDDHPTEKSCLELNWDNLRKVLSNQLYVAGTSPNYPPGCDVHLNLEEGPIFKWTPWTGGVIRPEIVAVHEKILQVCRATRPDCRFGFHNVPYQYFNAMMRTRTEPTLQAQFDRLSAAYQPFLDAVDFIAPVIYWSDSTRTELQQYEYTLRVLSQIRRFHTRKPIVPLVWPVVDRSKFVGGFDWAVGLAALEGIRNIVVWFENDVPWDDSAAWWIITQLWNMK